MDKRYDLLVITGPTATGKTRLAAVVADSLGTEVISADSRQVYRDMDLGTGKDIDDYIVNGRSVPVHLINIVDPGYKFNVFEFQKSFLKIYDDMVVRQKFPVVCGGSGMYLDSIVSSYRLIEVPPDENLRMELEKKSMEELIEILKSLKDLHNITDIDTKKRAIRAIEIEKYYAGLKGPGIEFPTINPLIIGIALERETRRKRISERLRTRFKKGMIDEVKSLMDKGISAETLIYYGLEYKFITLYLTGNMDYEEMFCRLEIAIHQFAKRQMTWFRGMERKGIKINWIDGELPMEEKVDRIFKLLGKS